MSDSTALATNVLDASEARRIAGDAAGDYPWPLRSAATLGAILGRTYGGFAGAALACGLVELRQQVAPDGPIAIYTMNPERSPILVLASDVRADRARFRARAVAHYFLRHVGLVYYVDERFESGHTAASAADAALEYLEVDAFVEAFAGAGSHRLGR